MQLCSETFGREVFCRLIVNCSVIRRDRVRVFAYKREHASTSSPVGSWEDRWVQSKHKDDYGAFVRTAGAFYGDAELDKGKPTAFLYFM